MYQWLAMDEDASSLGGDDESFALEHLERLTHGAMGGAETLDEFALRRQLVARGEFSAVDRVAQLGSDLLIRGPAGCWIEGHVMKLTSLD